jgi:hypothetical protein
MENNLRKDLVTKYFIKTPEKPNYNGQKFVIGIGLVLLIIGFTNDSLKTLFLIVAVCLIIYQLSIINSKNQEYKHAYARAEPKATDKEMDDWLKADQKMVLKEALKRLDIDFDETSADPLMIDGPTEQTNFHIGADKILRFNTHDILLFFLTEHHVAIFQCTLDLALGSILHEHTKEFPYKDITNLETGTENNYMQFINGKQTTVYGTQTFSLYTSGTNKISIRYFFNKSTGDGEDYILPPSDSENTIKAIRKRLKEYKDKFSASNI